MGIINRFETGPSAEKIFGMEKDFSGLNKPEKTEGVDEEKLQSIDDKIQEEIEGIGASLKSGDIDHVEALEKSIEEIARENEIPADEIWGWVLEDVAQVLSDDQTSYATALSEPKTIGFMGEEKDMYGVLDPNFESLLEYSGQSKEIEDIFGLGFESLAYDNPDFPITSDAYHVSDWEELVKAYKMKKEKEEKEKEKEEKAKREKIKLPESTGYYYGGGGDIGLEEQVDEGDITEAEKELPPEMQNLFQKIREKGSIIDGTDVRLAVDSLEKEDKTKKMSPDVAREIAEILEHKGVKSALREMMKTPRAVVLFIEFLQHKNMETALPLLESDGMDLLLRRLKDATKEKQIRTFIQRKVTPFVEDIQNPQLKNMAKLISDNIPDYITKEDLKVIPLLFQEALVVKKNIGGKKLREIINKMGEKYSGFARRHPEVFQTETERILDDQDRG